MTVRSSRGEENGGAVFQTKKITRGGTCHLHCVSVPVEDMRVTGVCFDDMSHSQESEKDHRVGLAPAFVLNYCALRSSHQGSK